jgi:hypothetical protein
MMHILRFLRRSPNTLPMDHNAGAKVILVLIINKPARAPYPDARQCNPIYPST